MNIRLGIKASVKASVSS